jgi:uncharacterized protein involved in exopolysaccharide biosynthesis
MGVLSPSARLPLWSDYPRFVRRHGAQIGVLMTMGILAGLAWSLTQGRTYSATSSVVPVSVPMYVIPSTAGLLPPPVSIDTDAQLLRSPEVLGAVADALGVAALEADHHVSVTATPNSSVLHVTVSASSADTAARAADAAVAAYVDVRRTALGALEQEQLLQLRLHIGQREKELAEQQTERLVVPARDELFTEVLELRDGLEELERGRREPVQVIDPAVTPARPDHDNTEVPVASGAMLGLLGGCLLGARQDRASRRPARPRSRQAPVRPGAAPGITSPREEALHGA